MRSKQVTRETVFLFQKKRKNITFPLSTVILLNRRQGRHPTERFLTAHASAIRVNIEKQIAEMKKNQPDKPSLNTLLLGT